MLSNKYFLLILSHKKSKNRIEQFSNLCKQENFNNFIVYYFIGAVDLNSDFFVDDTNKIVYLKTQDNYESLSLKTYKAIQYINLHYKNDIKGVFKTDDDIDINLDLLYKVLEENQDEKYFGNKCTNLDSKSSYHIGKCEDPRFNNNLVDIPTDTDYCSGGGYYIHKSLVEDIVRNDEPFYKILFEDIAMGKCMKDLGQNPKDVNVRDACKWEAENIYDLNFDDSVFPENSILDLHLSDENGDFNNGNTVILKKNVKPPTRLRVSQKIKISPEGPYRLKIVVS